MIVYGRMSGSGNCVVAVNNDENERQVEIPVWELGILDGCTVRQLMMTHKDGYNAGEKEYLVKDGKLVLRLPPYSGVLFCS